MAKTQMESLIAKVQCQIQLNCESTRSGLVEEIDPIEASASNEVVDLPRGDASEIDVIAGLELLKEARALSVSSESMTDSISNVRALDEVCSLPQKTSSKAVRNYIDDIAIYSPPISRANSLRDNFVLEEINVLRRELSSRVPSPIKTARVVTVRESEWRKDCQRGSPDTEVKDDW